MKFGKALSTLRKCADMTQNEVADRLNLSRQAISKYERGEGFPDISVLVMISELFGITLDELISYGEPSKGESSILKNVAKGNAEINAENIADAAVRMKEENITFSKKATKEIQDMFEKDMRILACALEMFENEDRSHMREIRAI